MSLPIKALASVRELFFVCLISLAWAYNYSLSQWAVADSIWVGAEEGVYYLFLHLLLNAARLGLGTHSKEVIDA